MAKTRFAIRVAHVDDNSDLRDLVRLILEGECEIIEFADGASALEQLPLSPPELILLDIGLPDIDGKEVLARLRSDDRLRGLPVVALTSHALPGDRERYVALGFDEYVAKPILDIPGFIALVHRLATPSAPGPSAGSREAEPLALLEAIHSTVVLEERAVRPQRDTAAIERFLDALERLVPDVPVLRHQIDSVRRWVRVLYRATEYERFGGRAHVRDHIVHTLKRARRTVEHHYGEAERHRRSGGA